MILLKNDVVKIDISDDINNNGTADGRSRLKDSLTPNKPRRTPDHPKKSHVVLAKEGGKES